MTTSEDVLEPALTHSKRLGIVTIKLADFNNEYADWALRHRYKFTKQQRSEFVDLIERQMNMIEELAETVDSISQDFIAIGEHQRDTYADLKRQFIEITGSEVE